MSSLLSGNRRRVLKGAAALGAYALSGPGARAAGKPFEGVELNASCWSAPFPKLLQGYLPEFEKLTGIKVNYDTPGFLIYNQRVDLELSTRGSSYDVLNITFRATTVTAGISRPICRASAATSFAGRPMI